MVIILIKFTEVNKLYRKIAISKNTNKLITSNRINPPLASGVDSILLSLKQFLRSVAAQKFSGSDIYLAGQHEELLICIISNGTAFG